LNGSGDIAVPEQALGKSKNTATYPRDRVVAAARGAFEALIPASDAVGLSDCRTEKAAEFSTVLSKAQYCDLTLLACGIAFLRVVGT
jgi:hypothetical protein